MGKATARVVLNRRALNALAGAFADGLGEIGRAAVEGANPPDATPYGVGLVDSGAWGVWAGGKKVEGAAVKPRSEKLNRTGLTMFAGFGFPGRFQETGTSRQPARPFFTPSILRVIPDAGSYIRQAVKRVDTGRR